MHSNFLNSEYSYSIPKIQDDYSFKYDQDYFFNYQKLGTLNDQFQQDNKSQSFQEFEKQKSLNSQLDINIENNSNTQKQLNAKRFLGFQFNNNEYPIIVNEKQFNRMMIMRIKKAKKQQQIKEQINKTIQKDYKYESRHIHACNRIRGPDGKFIKSNHILSQADKKQNNNANEKSTTENSNEDLNLKQENLQLLLDFQ